MKYILVCIVGIIILVVIIGGIFLLINGLVKALEETECKQWQTDSQKFEGWWSTDWQKEQCVQFDIILK